MIYRQLTFPFVEDSAVRDSYLFLMQQEVVVQRTFEIKARNVEHARDILLDVAKVDYQLEERLPHDDGQVIHRLNYHKIYSTRIPPEPSQL